MEFAALTLPSHPYALTLAPDPAAVQQEKSVSVYGGAEALIEQGDTGNGLM
ncbi:hypothetical protein Amal_03712 [Acetobacter malorum]|uniref:Uncharacterized protein n=1 Tax=Acetobacter malorum TaxID=178901 RepID=A0A177G5M1_9PROT|nr:hypothetical protein Amal_03712 [Acetobacter malorum]